MSEENVEVIRDGYRAWQRGGLDALLERLDPDFEFEEDPRFPDGGIYRGRDEFGAYVRQFMDVWDRWGFELKEARDAGSDMVFTRFIIRGRARGSGLGTELEAGWLWTLRVGRAVHCRAYLDVAEALEAAGLEE